MIIDWFTVIAQIVNFLILVALLKFFLFGRIRTAMQERKKQIVSQLDEAKEKQDLAKHELDSYRKENLKLNEQKEQMLKEAAQEASRKREEYLAQAREDARKEQDRLRDILNQKKNEFAERLMLMNVQDSTRIASRIISDLAGKNLEEGLVDVFIQRLKAIEADRKEKLKSATLKKEHPITVTTSFDLSDSLRGKLLDAFKKELSETISIRYQRSSDFILGIEASADGYKVNWKADQFLEDIEEKVSRSIIDTFGQHREVAHD